MKIRSLAAFFVVFLLAHPAAWSKADSSGPVYPEVGKPMPDDFVLQNIKYFHQKAAQLSDFKGKWLVLDFWTLHCSSCIASFPKINDEAAAFKEQVQFMLVGAPQPMDAKSAIEDKYAAIGKRINLQVPCAFDSILFRRYDLLKVPYIIVVDPNGIVRAISHKIDSADLALLLAGKSPSLPKAYRTHEDRRQVNYTSRIPLLVRNNGGSDSDFLYRSLLKKCGSEMPYDAPKHIERSGNGLFQAARVTIDFLYNYAYFGQYRWSMASSEDSSLCASTWMRPLARVKDSALFITDDGVSVNAFCYSLKVPPVKATKKYLMKVMQADLENYFGYKAEVVDKEMPCLKLVIINEHKIPRRTKDDTSTSRQFSALKLYLANFSIKQLMTRLDDLQESREMPIIDETGIDYKLNLSMDCYWEKYIDVRRSLNMNGLDLVKSTKVMKVLVISEGE